MMEQLHHRFTFVEIKADYKGMFSSYYIMGTSWCEKHQKLVGRSPKTIAPYAGIWFPE